MAAITRSAHPSALWPGIKAWFGLQYAEVPPQWSQVFEKETSDKAYEKVVEATGFGLAPVKSEGGSIMYDTAQEGYSTQFTHVVYGLGYIVTEEELEDNQYAELSRRRSRALAYSMRNTAEIVHANILNLAFAGRNGGDGVVLCSAAHPTLAGNQSNLLTPADLSETAIEDGLKAIAVMRNSRGLLVGARVRQLIVSPGDMFNAERILNSALRSGTANNDVNAIRNMGAVPSFTVNPFLTDQDAWFLQTNVPEGLKSYWRREVALERDQDFDTANAKAKATMRFAAGHGDWRCIFGSAGA